MKINKKELAKMEIFIIAVPAIIMVLWLSYLWFWPLQIFYNEDKDECTEYKCIYWHRPGSYTWIQSAPCEEDTGEYSSEKKAFYSDEMTSRCNKWINK